ncbi:MAG: sulfatase [Acidobacteria bacterium]|nr:sulfatase [Acidobacteriota bacterium]
MSTSIARRDFLTVPLAAALARAQTKRRLNVLMIAVDDLRPETGCYGSPIVKSPNIDRLARGGVLFRRAYCQQAVCSPSRSSLMTGTRPDTTKVWDLETHFRAALPNVVTLPQHFKQHGYFTQGMGKLYHGGFDDEPSWSTPWTTGRPPHRPYALEENMAIVRRRQAESGAGTKKKKKGAAARTNGPAYESADVPDNAYLDGAVADMAVAALRERAAHPEQPFWLGVGFSKPHLPFVAPRKYWGLYDPSQIPLAPNRHLPKDAPPYAILPGGELRNYHGIPSGPIPDDLARTLKHAYYASVSYMDAQLGRVLNELDQLGLAENTVIALWGDHGWKLGEHDAWCKHSNAENDTNAPLIVASPAHRRTAGRVSDALCEFVDLYPTLAGLCGLPLPSHLEGASLEPVLRDPVRSRVKKAAFSQYPRTAQGGERLMGYSMRTERHRLTRWVYREDPSRTDAVELYDHNADPREDANLANDPRQAATLAALTRQWQTGWRGARLRA